MSGDWSEANHRYLAAALHWLRLALRRHAEGGRPPRPGWRVPQGDQGPGPPGVRGR